MAWEVDSEVAIFWDYENCHPPCNVSGKKLVDGIRRLVQAHGSIKVFKIYTDVSLERPQSLVLLDQLRDSGVTVVDCPHNGIKEVADKKMMGIPIRICTSGLRKLTLSEADMLAFKSDSRGPVTVVIITDDHGFASAITDLKTKGRRIVIFTHNMEKVTSKIQADVVIDWRLIVDDATVAESSGSGSDRPVNCPDATKSGGPGTENKRVHILTDSRLPGCSVASQNGDTLRGAEVRNPTTIATSQPRGGNSQGLSVHLQLQCGVTSQPSVDSSTPYSMCCAVVGLPHISSLHRFRPLIDYFYDNHILTDNTGVRASVVAEELLKRDPKVYKNAAVRQMKQYVEEARRAELVVSSGWSKRGDCRIKASSNLLAFVAACKGNADTNSLPKSQQNPDPVPQKTIGAMSCLFEPLIDRLRAEQPPYELSDTTLGPFFRAEYPDIYKLANVRRLSRYLRMAADRGLVHFNGADSFGRQCVRLIRALWKK